MDHEQEIDLALLGFSPGGGGWRGPASEGAAEAAEAVDAAGLEQKSAQALASTVQFSSTAPLWKPARWSNDRSSDSASVSDPEHWFATPSSVTARTSVRDVNCCAAHACGRA